MAIVQGVPLTASPLVPRRRTIVVGVLGCGTVGGGVVARLLDTECIGSAPARLARILVRDLKKTRFPASARDYLTDDAALVVDDPTVDIVVETIGGIDAARTLVERALRNGKHVVSANKALIATHGRALAELAREYHVALRYEAAVGGAVPIVRAVAEAMVAEEMLEIAGVMNGTSNFIVSAMAAGKAFDEVVRCAQEAGYAEPDPSADVDGHDAAQKLTVLTALGFACAPPVDGIWKRSLRHLQPEDFQLAAELGYAIVPLALARREAEGAAGMVAPAFVGRNHDFARAEGPGNVIRVHGRYSGPLQFSGQGAGRVATASAIYSDLADIAQKMARWEYQGASVPVSQISFRCSLALPVIIRCGDLAIETVTTALAGLGCDVHVLRPGVLQTAAVALDLLEERLLMLNNARANFFPLFDEAQMS